VKRRSETHHGKFAYRKQLGDENFWRRVEGMVTEESSEQDRLA
jgi:hypothetical protein